MWQRIATTTNVFGEITTKSNQVYLEVATGLNFWDPAAAQWRESKEEFEVTPDGHFVARKGQMQLTLAPNLNSSAGAVRLVLPDGKQTLVSQPMFLSFFDTSSGASVLVGQIKDCAGELIASNVVLYPDAFSDIRGSVRYTYTKSGTEQDIVLYDNVSPAEYGLTNTEAVTLDMFSEFTGGPTPRIQSVGLASGLPDETLDFGLMSIGAGRAFLWGETESAISVSRSWQVIEGRAFLIESVPYTAAQPALNQLPASAGHAARKPAPSRAQMMAGLRPKAGGKTAATIPANGWSAQRGFVLDYTTINSSQTNYPPFQADMTYYLSGNVSLYGTNTCFEGLTVLKYASGVSLTVNTPVTWTGDNYRPVVMASKDDNSVGWTISGSTGTPGSSYYASKALSFDATAANTNLVLKNLRVLNARTAVAVNGGSGHVLSDVQLGICANGLALTNAEVSLRNALFWNVLTNFTGSTATGRVEHLTSDTAIWLNSDIGTNLYLTNCVLAGVTNWGNYSALQNVSSNASSSGVFQSAAGGAHYLGADSTNRNAGTTGINATLQAGLNKKTTYPPIVYSNATITVATTFSPQAQRDTDTLDIGFHYDSLDYVFAGTTANSNLTFTAGTAVGWFRTSSCWSSCGYGLHMADDTEVKFDGTATAPDYWVRQNTVAEQDRSGGYGPGGIVGWTGVFTGGGLSDAAKVIGRFLRCSSMANDAMHFRDYGYFKVMVTDSEFWGGGMGGYGTMAYYTNCFFDRVSVWMDNQDSFPTMILRNCLMRGGVLSFSHRGGVNWYSSVRDCAFDGTSFSIEDHSGGSSTYVDYDYNAFLQGVAHANMIGTNDVTVTNTFNWQSSWLGNFYLPTNSTLIDAGSRTADAAALYHYTTQTNQTKETTSTVDIGYHYVAVDGNGMPLDYDGDGIPDYLEDSNGNGSADSGETDWQSYNSQNNLTDGNGVVVFTPLK